MHVRTSAVAVLLLAAACVRNPATGKLELDLISESQEIQMGQDAKKEVEQSIGLYGDTKVRDYISGIGKNIAPLADRPNLPWSYEVVDDASVNAFALPGGPVFITRGILGYMNSEAELISVLGHESGHIAARHSANQLSKAELAQVGLGVGSVLSPALRSLGQVAGAGLQVLFLKYSRDDETQADSLGFRYTDKLGYDPAQMLELFKMLDGVTKAAGGGKLPEWTQTHPIPEHRSQTTTEWLKKLGHDTASQKVDRERYMKAIDGIEFGENPRHGYFKGNEFLHPDLKFKLQLPDGWKHQNTPQAVLAASPRQDAIFELASAGKESPRDVAQKFLSQKGIQAQKAAEGKVNGKDAVSAYFSGQSQQGPIEGVVTFVSHGGETFALLGYTPQGGMQGYDATFRSTMGSFNDLTDHAALDVKPAKLKVVKLDHATSLDDFMREHPSTVSKQTLAIINGLDLEGGTLQPGWAKQVEGGIPEEQLREMTQPSGK